ncbi:MAG TPA: long-chain fatty acid--CoA ligase [Verrucomicrobiae bacterium]|nr:long-chain fatty acid--CoA ligase [Verrucomicrobiae bacterium]
MKYASLAAMFLSQAERYGDRALYRYHREGKWLTMSWTDALSRVRDLSLALSARGLVRGDRVALFFPNRVEWCLIDWANISIGALTVPVYASSTSAQAAYILRHSGATVLFVDSANRLKGLGDSVADLRLIVVLDHAAEPESPLHGPPIVSLSDVERSGRQQGGGDRFDALVGSLGPEDDLTIIYTSGTTGEPKGVLTTHRHYLFMLEAAAAAVPCGEDDGDMLFLPLAQSLGRVEHFFVVHQGMTCGLARSLETIAKDLPEVRPTILISVPRVFENGYERIRSRAEAGGAVRRAVFRWAVSVGARWSRYQSAGKKIPAFLRLAHNVAARLVFKRIHEGFGGRLRFAISGGAALAEEVARFFHSVGILILQGYGLTESSTVSHVNRFWHYKFATVGPPLPGVECRTAEDGEILLRGPNIMKGYWRDADGTRAAVDADGWLHTGDIGTIDADGFLTITDRKKDLIVTSGGKKVAPQMIENLLRADPLIEEAIVLGDGERHLIALVTLDRQGLSEWAARQGVSLAGLEEAASHPQITAAVRERIRSVNKRLAAYEAVRNFRILPRGFSLDKAEVTPTLKLRREIIKERYKDLIQDMARRPRFDAE